MAGTLTLEVPHEGEARDATPSASPTPSPAPRRAPAAKVRWAGYLRSSTAQQQRNAKSLDAQEAELRAYVKDKGYPARGDVFCDILSGRKDRYEFNQLLDLVDRGDVDVVLTWEVSRFGRDGFSNALLAHKCRENGIRIEVVTGGQYELDDPFDKFVFGILSQLAEYERDLILMRLARGREHGFERGCWVNGIPPFGYTTDGPKGNRRLVLTPESAYVPQIYDRYLAGESTYKIAQWMRGLGVRHNLMKEGKAPLWAPDTIAKILENVHYLGWIVWADKKVKGAHPPLVTQATFDAAQRRREEQRRRHPGRPKRAT